MPNLVVTDLMEMRISILISILTWISQKNLRLGSPYWKIFKIRNTNLQFWNPAHGWQKNKKKNKKKKKKKRNTGNCKALCVSRNRKKTRNLLMPGNFDNQLFYVQFNFYPLVWIFSFVKSLKRIEIYRKENFNFY